MTYRTYEFTAFAESDLLSGGDSNLGPGDCFTMPASATTCFTVCDNDAFLSGDSWRNEHANDRYGQKADIVDLDGNELGNGGQIYAESYYWVHDQDGNWYVMVQIEQEHGDTDYFTFYNGSGHPTPPEGAQLTISSQKNVTSNWLDYKCLDAGEKPQPDPWSFDPDTCTYTIEAEDLDLHGFHVVDGAKASGGELVKLSGHDGKLSTDFGGEDGIYNLKICVQDECDGASKLKVFVNGEMQQVVILDRDSDGGGSDNGYFSEFTLQGLEIAEGDIVEIRAWRDDGEYVRIDALKFEQVKFEVCDDPDAVKVDFEGFVAGDVIGSQIDGVTISAMGGSGDAMIFDSQNPTGGDDDLETQVAQLGNVLIVSEDGDSSDPDDAIGGKLVFDFDNPSTVFDIKIVDTEEGGTITLTLEDGSTQAFDIPNLVNGGVGQVVMNVENVVSMEIQLDGSGAVDDLCFVPGAEPLGSLSGRYFCDENRDGLDNDGAGNGVAGVLVALLDAAGNAVLDALGDPVTTMTDADGNYSFGDLVAGTYGVKFTDSVSGKDLTTQNVDGDTSDDIDSDAADLGGGMSIIETIVVVAGQNTPDNDAGVVERPGALSGTYFCDDDRDGVDDGAAAGDADIAGKVVMLFEADGVTPATDIDGNPVAATLTDPNGDYRFDNLGARDYVVMFEATEGKEFIAPDQGGDETVDSDVVDAANGKTAPVTVTAGQETKDVDAGVQELLGSLSGRYFCDDDGDGLDNDGPDNGVQNVLVELFDGAGNSTGRTTTTDAQGNYSFTGLVAGTYAVLFTDAVSAKELTTQNVDGDISDDIDSDAEDIGGGQSIIENIVVVAGQNTPDNDAGVVQPNGDPDATDDAGIGCADETIIVNLSDNYSDPDGDPVSITMLGSENIADGDTIFLDGTATTGTGDAFDFFGLEVTRDGDEFIFDAEAAFADLDIGESATANISFKVEDDQGGSDTANIELTVKGDANSVESLNESLPDTLISYQIADGVAGSAPFGDFGYDILITEADGDARFEGVTFEQAYCLDFLDPAATGRTFDTAPTNTADMFLASDPATSSVFEASQVGINGETAAENLDLITWILNQDFENDGTGSVDGTFTGWEVQFAIWELTNSVDSDLTFNAAPELGQTEDVDFIVQQALANGEDFEAGVGDIVGVILDPNPATSNNAQPFILGIAFEEYDCIC
ncbi:SdrD B-like domain-containing protein [uncultured Roseobacter sp.]|uniref:SdrD B-like domain-containing protein n=1 Tax=uncultured Roseobacter sp. TaxID=114847 RepID=UPI002605588E|nr:SdrD B-like domain-containing protein [uncultured Roseobacter sp.]